MGAFDVMGHRYSIFILHSEPMTQNQLKQGVVSTFQILQNTTTYQLRLTLLPKGLWACIAESGLTWKLTISPEMVEQTVKKTTGDKQTMTLKEFISNLLQAVTKTGDKWGLGIMTPVQLEVLRGGTASKQANNNKIYMILSDKQRKIHFPFTFLMNDVSEKDKMIEAIKTMKAQLEELRLEKADKSQSSFSIMSETYSMAEQIKQENQEMKRKIKVYQQSLTQKRGAVEIDMILKEKNNLELLAQTKKRQQNREITRLKNVYQMMERDIAEVQQQIWVINKQLLMLEDNAGGVNKLKSHALKVLKSFENELRTQKKVLQKQVKEIESFKRNINTSKNNEKKVLAKIKQIQMEIDQAKKKANIKQISNRLYSKGRNPSSVVDSSDKSQSVASSTGKIPSQTSSKGKPGNLVRDNLLKKVAPMSSSNRNNLLKTTPNINGNTNSVRKSSDQIPQGRAVNSSHQAPKNYNSGTNARLFNTQKYRSGSKSQNQRSVDSNSLQKKKEITPEERQRQRKAIQRLTGGNKANVPRVPSAERNIKQTKVENNRMGGQLRGGSLGKGTSGSNEKGVAQKGKDSAKEMLAKMKEIKAHYNKQTNANAVSSKAIDNKLSELRNK